MADPRQTQHLKALYHLTKSLDATRPVIDNDGWEHTDVTDLFGIHDYGGARGATGGEVCGAGPEGVCVPGERAGGVGAGLQVQRVAGVFE